MEWKNIRNNFMILKDVSFFIKKIFLSEKYQLKKSPEDKMNAVEYQKYYTGAAIVLMLVVLICMYLILN